MLVPNLLMWAASGAGAVWKVSQLIRVPEDRGLRVVTTCTLLVFTALTAQLAASIPDLGIFPESAPKLLQNVFLTVFFALLLVLLQSHGRPELRAAMGYREIALSLLASAGLIAAFAAADPVDRGASYEEVHGDLGVLTFYLVGNFYMAYATARGSHLAWKAAGHTVSRARLSLRVAGAGLVVCCVGTHVPRVIATAGMITVGTPVLPGTESWTTPLLAIGISVFFLGIAFPGLRTGWAKTRLRLRQWRRYQQLRPLWEMLYEQWPHIALLEPRSPFRDALDPRQLRLRYYRRVIEVRDGLVLMSPYMDVVDEPVSPRYQAERLQVAVARKQRGEQPISAASVIAPPREGSQDGDIDELLQLARSLNQPAR